MTADDLVKVYLNHNAPESLKPDEIEPAWRDVERAIAIALGETDYRPSQSFVHPKVYAQRAECPDWTGQPNPAHVHNRHCSPSA